MTRLLTPLAAALLAAGPAAAADPPAEYRVPYRLTDTKHVLVRAKLNGKGPFNLILDTGAPAVFIPKKVAQQAGVKLDPQGWGNFDTFEVEGGVAVEKARTRVEDLFQLEGMNGLGLAGVELHGVIGYNVLAKYRITYDFTADKLAWVPLDGFEPPAIQRVGGGGQGGLEILGPIMKVFASFMGIQPNFDVKPRGLLGVELKDGDGVVVKAVLPGGPADKAGLKAGDTIEALGTAAKGSKVRPRMRDVDTPRDLERAVADALPGDEVTVKVQRGGQSETVVVTLGKGL